MPLPPLPVEPSVSCPAFSASASSAPGRRAARRCARSAGRSAPAPSRAWPRSRRARASPRRPRVGLARGRLGGLARAPLGELVAVRRRASGTPGRLPPTASDTSTGSTGGFKRPGETRGHDRGGGRGIHHRRIDGLLHVLACGRCLTATPRSRARSTGLVREGRDERPTLAAEPGELRGVEVVLRFRSAAASSSASPSWPSRARRFTAGRDRRLAQRLEPRGAGRARRRHGHRAAR